MPWRHYEALRLLWSRSGRWWEQWLEITGKKWKKRRKNNTSSFRVVSITAAECCYCYNFPTCMNAPLVKEVYCPHVVNWQISLIPTEIASAQVKVVSDSPKKCVFNRRAGVKSQTSATEETPQSSKVQTPQNQEDTPSFVFTSSKEEFRFNFLWFVQ